MLERFKVPDTDKVYIQSNKIFELTKNILKDLGVSDEGASNSASVLIAVSYTHLTLPTKA